MTEVTPAMVDAAVAEHRKGWHTTPIVMRAAIEAALQAREEEE